MVQLSHPYVTTDLLHYLSKSESNQRWATCCTASEPGWTLQSCSIGSTGSWSGKLGLRPHSRPPGSEPEIWPELQWSGCTRPEKHSSRRLRRRTTPSCLLLSQTETSCVSLDHRTSLDSASLPAKWRAWAQLASIPSAYYDKCTETTLGNWGLQEWWWKHFSTETGSGSSPSLSPSSGACPRRLGDHRVEWSAFLEWPFYLHIFK